MFLSLRYEGLWVVYFDIIAGKFHFSVDVADYIKLFPCDIVSAVNLV